MIELSQRLRSLPGYPLAEIPTIKRRLIESGMDVIDLGAGDNDTPPPSVVVDACTRRSMIPRSASTDFNRGSWRTGRPRCAGSSDASGNASIRPPRLLPLIGSKEGLSHLPFAVVNPGDVTIVPEPGYQAYLGGSLLAGAKPHVSPYAPRIDSCSISMRFRRTCCADQAGLRQLSEQSDCRNRAARISGAHGGHVPASRDPSRVRQRLLRPHLRRVSGAQHLRDPGARDVALEFFSLSKSFSMTGWRIGFVVGNKELVGALMRVKSYVDTGPFLARADARGWPRSIGRKSWSSHPSGARTAARCGGWGAA